MTTTIQQAGQAFGLADEAITEAAVKAEALKVLGLKDGAKEGEVKKAYRALALGAHPDKFDKKHYKNADEARDAFQKATEAYQVLTDQVEPEADDDADVDADAAGDDAEKADADEEYEDGIRFPDKQTYQIFLAHAKRAGEALKKPAISGEGVIPFAVAYVHTTTDKHGILSAAVQTTGTTKKDFDDLLEGLEEGQTFIFTHIDVPKEWRPELFNALERNKLNEGGLSAAYFPKDFLAKEEKARMAQITPSLLRRTGSFILAIPRKTWDAVTHNKLALALTLAAGVVASLMTAGLLIPAVAALAVGGSTKYLVDKRHALIHADGDDIPENEVTQRAADVGEAAGHSWKGYGKSYLPSQAWAYARAPRAFYVGMGEGMDNAADEREKAAAAPAAAKKVSARA